ncbi:MAG: RluA family pseudouridine synthase [Desulfovibrionaceae bacterium]|nr:RluA family pseudouridine synthase [Desulfovibrionaceae bacterium]
MPTHDGRPAEYVVTPDESGQKLLQFLQRRLHLPQSLLHRWVRTGQVRCNGGRCKPFTRVACGDTVRLPPFAMKMAAQGDTVQTMAPPDMLPPLPPLVGEADGILAFFKPAGLPTHDGTGHTDSLAGRLAAHYARADFAPTPAHRLDKNTTGLLLVATSYTALRQIQECMQQGLLAKEYLAWVHGRWPWPEERLLCHMLRKESRQGLERMHTVEAGGKEARCLVRPLRTHGQSSLLHVRLLTGRTHQIRAQLAQEGHAVLGDSKYGTASGGSRRMYLHSLRVSLPDGRSFACLPDWPVPRALEALPPPLFLPKDKGLM